MLLNFLDPDVVGTHACAVSAKIGEAASAGRLVVADSALLSLKYFCGLKAATKRRD